MTWWDERLCAFDVESTGVNTETDRIVTAAVVEVGGGDPTVVADWLVNPGVPIPESASAIHGITDDKAADGAPAAEAVAGIINTLHARPRGAPVIAMNARFDLTMLDREARRYGIEPLGERGPLYVVDPMVIDRWLHRYRKGKRTLAVMCEHYGATLAEAHEAGADAIAAARLAWVLAAKGEPVQRDFHQRSAMQQLWDRVRGDLPRLHQAQVGWAREQGIGLAAYFRKQGREDDAASVQLDWPVVPAPTSTAKAA